jgi:hypothetical protein
MNAEPGQFRLLTGIEVDILEDGGLDQRSDLLDRLDLVVASVHSGLRMPAAEMTMRMVTAVSSPHVDVLGHCTGRMIMGRGRPESQFDARELFRTIHLAVAGESISAALTACGGGHCACKSGSGIRSPSRSKPAPVSATARAPPHQTASGDVASSAPPTAGPRATPAVKVRP